MGTRRTIGPVTAEKPLLVFDGDCAFCTTWVQRLERMLPVFPEAHPWQWLDLDAIGLSLLRIQRPFGLRFLGHLLVTPPFSWAAAVGYAVVARFRHRLPGGTHACALPRSAA